MGTCIARQNHRFFITFLVSAGFASLYACIIASVAVSRTPNKWARVETYLLCGAAFCLGWIGLTVFFAGLGHGIIVLSDTTTKERLSKRLQPRSFYQPTEPLTLGSPQESSTE